jgi:signal transduction histidine kinase
VREVESGHPGRSIRLVCEGDMVGMWDEERIAQAVSNLLGNALKHGAAEAPIRLEVQGHLDDEVRIGVHSLGPAIPREVRSSLFEPLVRGGDADRSGISLGLGLYIVRAIAAAHGGSADLASSTTDGTEFCIRLPRRSEAFEPSAFSHLRMG